jgi:hypothetical protein
MAEFCHNYDGRDNADRDATGRGDDAPRGKGEALSHGDPVLDTARPAGAAMPRVV